MPNQGYNVTNEERRTTWVVELGRFLHKRRALLTASTALLIPPLMLWLLLWVTETEAPDDGIGAISANRKATEFLAALPTDQGLYYFLALLPGFVCVWRALKHRRPAEPEERPGDDDNNIELSRSIAYTQRRRALAWPISSRPCCSAQSSSCSSAAGCSRLDANDRDKFRIRCPNSAGSPSWPPLRPQSLVSSWRHRGCRRSLSDTSHRCCSTRYRTQIGRGDSSSNESNPVPHGRSSMQFNPLIDHGFAVPSSRRFCFVKSCGAKHWFNPSL